MSESWFDKHWGKVFIVAIILYVTLCVLVEMSKAQSLGDPAYWRVERVDTVDVYVPSPKGPFTCDTDIAPVYVVDTTYARIPGRWSFTVTITDSIILGTNLTQTFYDTTWIAPVVGCSRDTRYPTVSEFRCLLFGLWDTVLVSHDDSSMISIWLEINDRDNIVYDRDGDPSCDGEVAMKVPDSCAGWVYAIVRRR